MDEILQGLGFKGLNDSVSVIQWCDFQKIDVEKIRSVLLDLGMHDTNLTQSDESKFEYINLILMLKYEVFIDVIKDIDFLPMKGFHLERMP